MNFFWRLVSAFVIGALVLIAVALATAAMIRLRPELFDIGLLALALLTAIIARVIQAADHHAEVRRLLGRK